INSLKFLSIFLIFFKHKITKKIIKKFLCRFFIIKKFPKFYFFLIRKISAFFQIQTQKIAFF
ncbi:MAG: hypothetical protein B6I24_04105, partial [Bacteroidetes bacterium 4572_128]